MTDIHVLHIDDEPGFADVTADFLERENDRLTVETAISASEGLKRLAEGDFDCIVSDYQMPDQDGIEFLETVRDTLPTVPFILFTGKGSEEVASDAISAGATDYLQKDSGTDQYELLANRLQNAVEKQRAQEEVTVTEQRLRTIAKNTNDILWKFSADWDELLFINSAYEEIWGRSITELQEHPQSFLDGVHPDDRDSVKETMEQMSAGESVDTEYRVNADEDYSRWVWVQGEPVFDEAGKVEKVVGFARDVTERKQRERKLRLRSNRFRTLFENLGEPVVEVIFEDNKPIIERMNKQFMDTFSVGEEATGEILDDLIVPDDDETHVSINGRASDGDPIEREVRRGTDEIRPYLFRSAPFTGPNNRQRGHGIYIDISERKQREQELERQNERLEKFASVVSHDLRNPLNVASGHLELAQRECDSDHLNDIAQAHDRMSTLIDDLLTLAEEGERVDETEVVDLAATIDDCWRTVETADATLAIETEQTIQADRNRLKQLLENLFRNSVEHGGENVTVKVGELKDGFYVADDGPGIPDDKGEHVFDAGYSTGKEGTGLGLNIVQEIAYAHRWNITVTTGKAGGARLEITGMENADE